MNFLPQKTWWSMGGIFHFQNQNHPSPSPSSPSPSPFSPFFGGGRGGGRGREGEGGKPPPPPPPGRGGDEVPPPPDFTKTFFYQNLQIFKICVIYPRGFSLSPQLKTTKLMVSSQQNSLWHTSIFIFIYIYYISPLNKYY